MFYWLVAPFCCPWSSACVLFILQYAISKQPAVSKAKDTSDSVCDCGAHGCIWAGLPWSFLWSEEESSQNSHSVIFISFSPFYTQLNLCFRRACVSSSITTEVKATSSDVSNWRSYILDRASQKAQYSAAAVVGCPEWVLCILQLVLKKFRVL